jgi:hypothetical protein
MAFFTSMFRNLKDGGAVYEKPSRFHQWIIDNPGGIRKKDGGEVKSQFLRPLTAPIAYKEGGEVKSGFFYNLSKNPEMMKLIQKANNQPKAPIRKKEGGVVEARTPFQQAIHDTFLKAAGGGGIHYRKKGGVVKKKGERVPKGGSRTGSKRTEKSKTKKQKK